MEIFETATFYVILIDHYMYSIKKMTFIILGL